MKFQTQYNQRDHNHIGEVFRKPSMSVPDSALSLAQLVNNHLHDLPTTGREKQKVFLGEDTIVDFTMDNIDRQDMLDGVTAEINSIRSEHLLKVEEKQQKQTKKAPPSSSDEKEDAAGGERSTEQPQAKRSEATGAK